MPLTPVERAFLNSEDFRRRFLESYIAETDVEPRLSASERKVMSEVLVLITAEKLEDAAKLLRDQMGPASTAAFDYTLGQIHFQRDELDHAAASYMLAVEKHPRFRRAWANLGQVHFRRGEFRSAARAFSRMIELGGGDAITYGLLGIAHTKVEEYVAAESAFRMAAMMSPETLDWKMGLAESLFRQRRFADAVALFQGLIERHPDRSQLWLLQGEAYAMLGQPLKAAENFEMVDRLGNATVASLNNLGDIYANQELYDLAVKSYLRALEKDPNASPRRAIRAARYLSANGAIEDATILVDGIQALRGAKLETDEHKDLLRVRVLLAMARGAGEDEARMLKEIVDLDPMDGDALIRLGQYNGRSGNVEQAVFYFERASGIEAFEADARLRHGELMVRQGRYSDALPFLRRALALKPRDDVQRFVEQVERAAQTSK